MYSMYPKGKGKLPSAGRKGRKSREEETDSVYLARTSITGGEEFRMRSVYDSEYGKKPTPDGRVGKGVPVSPRKTQISI